MINIPFKFHYSLKDRTLRVLNLILSYTYNLIILNVIILSIKFKSYLKDHRNNLIILKYRSLTVLKLKTKLNHFKCRIPIMLNFKLISKTTEIT